MVDARVQKSKQALIDAGLKLININKEISLRDIATEAGVGRATLYRLFSSKEALVEEIAVYCLQKIDDASAPIEQKSRSNIHAFELMFQYLMPMTDEFQFLLSLDYFADEIPQVQSIIDRQDQDLYAFINSAKEDGEITKKMPTTWIANFIEGLFYAGWVQQKEHGANVEEAADLAFTCFKRALKPSMFK